MYQIWMYLYRVMIFCLHKQDEFHSQTKKLLKLITNTMIVFPMNLTTMHDLPTSYPAPK